MSARLAITAVVLMTAALVGHISARLLPAWTYQDLFTKSDLVVIANPIAKTHDTSERTILRDTHEDVIGVETQFETQVVLKGGNRSRFALHHYRSAPSKVAIVNGASFISFDPKHSDRAYVLFLKRESDGRFAPTGGQTDPDISVLEMRSPNSVGTRD